MIPPEPRKLILEFTKMSGAGNDFIVIDNRFYYFTVPELADLARRFCPRKVGVGADGLLALDPARGDVAAFRMRYLNADGSVGTMCGNGARCLARFALDAGIPGPVISFETDAGEYEASFPAEGGVRLAIPSFRDFERIATDREGPERYYVWTGTEHLVVFVDNLDTTDVENLGRSLRHTNAPHGANVNFAEVRPDHIRVRTWEKGVEAETLACGTGATAVAAACRIIGTVQRPEVQIQMPGGTLRVGFSKDGRAIYLEGPAEYIFRGTLEV